MRLDPQDPDPEGFLTTPGPLSAPVSYPYPRQGQDVSLPFTGTTKTVPRAYGHYGCVGVFTRKGGQSPTVVYRVRVQPRRDLDRPT